MISTHWMKTALLILVLALSAVAASAMEDNTSQTSSSIKVTVQLRDTPVIDAIDQVFKDTGYKYTIEPGVSGNITVGFKDVEFEQAVKTLSEVAGLNYQVKAGRYIFRPDKQITESKPAVQPALVNNDNAASMPDDESNVYEPNPTDGPDSPIFYGNYFPELPPELFPYDIGYLRNYPFLPPGTGLDIPGDYSGAPQVLPPPHLRSPSLNRMLDQMYKVHSYPGFRGPSLGYPYGGFQLR